jgi:hypothetical protein
MWIAPKRSRAIVVLCCCCFVLLAASAHLLHASHFHRRHGKSVADLDSSLYVFAPHAIGTAYAPPVFATLLIHQSDESDHRAVDGLLQIQIGRAPPSCA